MRSFLLLFLLIPPVALAAAPPVDTTLITHVRVIDGTGRPPIEDATVTIVGDKIASISRAHAAVGAAPNAHIVDGSGKTVIPGLINAHGHLALVDDTKNSSDSYTRERVIAELRQYERYGVTTMLSLGLNRDLVYGVRGEQRRGALDGATILVADRGIGVPDGMPPIPHQPDQLYQPATVEEARKDVDEAAARGTDLVKIWVDDLYRTKPKMDPAVYRAAIEEAHRHHIRVAAHVYRLSDAKQLVRDGVDVLAHSVRDTTIDAEFIQLMKEHGTFYIPTLTVDESFFAYAGHPAWMDRAFFRDAISPNLYAMLTSKSYQDQVKNDPLTPVHRQDYENARRNLKLALDAGLKVGFGTDSGASPYRIPGFAEHHELAMMVEAGLTPIEAIHAATGENAELLKIAERTGTIQPGRQADLILLGSNPVDDIHNTERIVAIWHGGREAKPEAGGLH
ncbi:amidohydrolase family protein [Granulicella sp. WH15]|uniref:amidohydrolase family protein n=1 Tax=Granulicella sp. WH15 TaxID=2602070 RepID=UPI001367613D|nr:amidohydrolase family protein [Granulicella sp. WH15]QHN03847.1 amidohydrolase family protein [Granulicella sp. WH15]